MILFKEWGANGNTYVLFIGVVTNVSKKIVDGPIKVAPSNKHKKTKGYN